MMMKNLAYILMCSFLWGNTNAQVLPKVNNYPELGLKFEVPDGWIAEQRGNIVMMGHEAITGLIIMSFNDAESAESLKKEAMEGLVDEGINLKAAGEFEISNVNKVTGTYEGFWDGAAVKCHAIGLINKIGSGVNILGVTTKDMYSETHVEVVEKVSQKVKFFTPTVTEQSERWRNMLVPANIEYLSTSYDTDYSGGSSGFSSNERIILCSNGYFDFYSNSHASVSAGDGYGGEVGGGYANSNGSSQGNFDIKTIGSQSYLILNFEGGEVYEYALSKNDDGNTLLNGTRYFVVETEDCN